jgi:hypothetical protein
MRLALIILCVIVTSCASSYKPIRPRDLNYNQPSNDSEINFSYRYDVLRERSNKKYAKREAKNGIRVVAVKLTNNSDQPLTIGTDVRLYTGRSEVLMIPPEFIHKSVKQGVPIYLLYLLLTPLQFTSGSTTSNGVVDSNSTPIGLVIGPGIALGNMLVAGSANKKFLDELTQCNLVNKTIQPGETVYGLIGIGSHIGFAPLEIQIN